jgi:hypothetical protein
MADPTKPDALTAEVRALERLDLPGLREEWRRRYGEPPTIRSADMLRRMLAWRMQADVWGGLDAWTRRQLRARGGPSAPDLDLGVGARITREWQGRRIELVTVAGGYDWEGQIYPSLSAAARAITGVRWNGPRFFGLRGKTA